VVLDIGDLVPATDVGDSGMVESLGRVTQWLARSRVTGCAVVIHDDLEANERRLNASLTGKTIKKSN
jgi:hypothetical protein